MARSDLQKLCLVGSVASICAGGAGMVLSFIYLGSRSMADITAGTSGFVAGSVMIGAGLLSASLVACAESGAKEQGASIDA